MSRFTQRNITLLSISLQLSRYRCLLWSHPVPYRKVPRSIHSIRRNWIVFYGLYKGCRLMTIQEQFTLKSACPSCSHSKEYWAGIWWNNWTISFGSSESSSISFSLARSLPTLEIPMMSVNFDQPLYFSWSLFYNRIPIS